MKKSIIFLAMSMAVVVSMKGADIVTKENKTTIRPDGGQAKVICLEVINDNIIRVRATSESVLPEKPASLMIVGQSAPRKGSYTVVEENGMVAVSTKNVKALASKATGEVAFFTADGKPLLKEAKDGKRFWPFTVPERELGMKGSTTLAGAEHTVPVSARNGLQWQMVFDSPDDEAFYGLGQHQAGELNMKGRNEDLFQYNTKVSMPFVLSDRGYGLLWDSYSYCRFGNPQDYRQLNRVFKLYDKHGKAGHLTGTYTDKTGKSIVRDEDSLYYEYACPEGSALARLTDDGGTKNLPKGFNLDGATVTYEGFIEVPAALERSEAFPTTLDASGDEQLYQFILYYAGYVKVFVGGREVVAERWRTSWNPNSHKFSCLLRPGERVQLRMEWRPDGGESYCGLRVAEPRPASERGQLSIWSEMARDMDYYFIAGNDADEVIGGYRTLTGRAPVCPKWALGFWQSRERYKTSLEVEETLAEFRRRQLPIDNIVQDWNYWPEDQWGSHLFESSRYPDPQAMLDSIHAMHGRFMISVWPKFYVNTDNYKTLDSHGWIYRQSSADGIRDWVGPGYENGFYDAYDPEARKMFWRLMAERLYPVAPPSAPEGATTASNAKTNEAPSGAVGGAYVDAWWMDASEPNVRDCTPMWYRKALCGPTALGTSTEFFNAYALMNAQAIYEGQRSVYARGGKGAVGEPRVFQLTRSGFPGLQRYSTATWSGDIGTRWEDMRAQMTAGLNYSMSGVPFWGMDQGGFCVERRYVEAQQLYDRTGQENEDLREWRELQTRWNQFGTFIPLFRVHGQWPLREPWNVAPDTHPSYQSFLYYDHLRYRLMPYLYSMAGWVHFRDYTLMRALVMDFNGDKNVSDIGDQWMFGPALMACPVGWYKARSRTVYFPRQRGWYDLYTGEKVINAGNDGDSPTVNRNPSSRQLVVDAPYGRIPVFVPEGAIIPFGPRMQWSDEKPAELIHLYVYAGRDGEFLLYEDEGVNYNYERGDYATISIRYDDHAHTLTIGQRKGQFKGMLKHRRFDIVYVTDDHPCPIDVLENQPANASSADDTIQGKLLEYDGKETTVRLF